MPTVERWARMEDFNPNSSNQVLAYLRFRGYKIFKDRKSGKPTADKESLEKTQRLLAIAGETDPLIDNILEARHLQKAIGYLLESRLGADSRYHPIYTFRPETGRLSAVRPNIMNQPNHGVDARVTQAIRACVVPSSPTRVLVEVDWKAMEAVLTGWFAGDEDYIAISKKDSHTYFCAFILKNAGKIDYIPPAQDPDIMDFLVDLKHRFPDERFKAKAANLAQGYGVGWRHLSEMIRVSAAEAKELNRIKDEMYPKVTEWKEKTILEAHRKGYLETPFGYRCYYWNVLEPVKGKKGQYRWGKEAREALAFRPQSSGAAMLREVMLSVAPLDGELFDILAPIHDALFVETEQKNLEKTIITLRKEMMRSWVELGGLSIEAEASVGRAWNQMEEVILFKGVPIIADQ